MVETLYVLILIPVLLYLFFSVLEIWLVYSIALRGHSRSLLFIQGSTELTHTLLVFAYAQFMVTFSSLLIDIGGELYWPIALLMATLLLRGSTYLLLFYRERPPRWMYLVLLGTYLVGVASLVWALLIVVPAIITKSFVPDTTNIDLVLTVGLPALAFVMIPIIAVYKSAFAALRRK